MFNNFKARLRKWADLGHEDFFRLIQWGGLPIETDNPHTLICSASRDGETLAYLTAQSVYVITNYTLKPGTDFTDLQKAGDAIDKALAIEGQKTGVGRFLIVLPEGCPKQQDEKTIRYIERDVPATKQHEQISERLLDEVNSPITTAWIN